MRAPSVAIAARASRAARRIRRLNSPVCSLVARKSMPFVQEQALSQQNLDGESAAESSRDFIACREDDGEEMDEMMEGSTDEVW